VQEAIAHILLQLGYWRHTCYTIVIYTAQFYYYAFYTF